MDWFTKRTLGDTLDIAAERYGDRPALSFQNQCWTYTDLNHEADLVAKGLLGLGIKNQENIAVWMTNRPEWIFLMYGIAKIGACIVPLNTRYRTDDVSYAVKQSKSTVIISLDKSGPINYQNMLAETLGNVKVDEKNNIHTDKYPDLKKIIILGKNEIKGSLSWQEMIQAGNNLKNTSLQMAKKNVDPDQRMMICYTSGTTGAPKGVVHSHIPIRNTYERSQSMGLTCNDVHMNYLPLFHIYAYSEITMMCILTGAKQVLMETFNGKDALTLAEKEKATILHGFEAHWLDLLNAQKEGDFNLSLRMGTLPSGVESTIPIAEAVQETFCPTISGFGMSETWAFVSISNLSHSQEQRVHTSGYPMNDYQFKIVDNESFEEKGNNEPGELWIKGYATMKEYWNKPEETAKTIDQDGWIHSGDMALRRDDGMIVFMGRYKDMLKVGGENVSPAEIETYLRAMDEILDAAVVALPDERLSEVPVAFIILNQNKEIKETDVISRMKGKIASFKIPKYIVFVDNFPMTSSGKVRKVELRQLAIKIFKKGK